MAGVIEPIVRYTNIKIKIHENVKMYYKCIK